MEEDHSRRELITTIAHPATLTFCIGGLVKEKLQLPPHFYGHSEYFLCTSPLLADSNNKVYIINLHDNSLKKETTPDGGKDENVFDIMTGVSINIFVKTGKKAKGKLAEVYYSDVWGARKCKYDFLSINTLESINWQKVNLAAPFYFFVPKDEEGKAEYDKGFKVEELLKTNSSGLVSMGDEFAYADTPEKLQDRLYDFLNNVHTPEELKSRYKLGKNYADFILDSKKKGVSICANKIVTIAYRPFDNVYGYFDKQIIWRTREKVMRHIIGRQNVCVVIARQCASDWRYVLATGKIAAFNLTGTAGRLGSGYVFPLYLYPEEGSMDTERRANLDETIWSEISRRAGRGTMPEEVFDYIYVVLHSPRYREQYKEFLKVDFPRIPYPESADRFGHFVSFGHRLRELHLMHTLPDMPDVATFPVSGDCVVGKPYFENDRVYINATQYFGHVPETAWQFYIGGYQPAQKWLKDRKGRTLTFDDTRHYRKIVAVLLETDRLMKELDKR